MKATFIIHNSEKKCFVGLPFDKIPTELVKKNTY